jgi:hypothetical protein
MVAPMSAQNVEISGGCRCGAVRYRSSAAPLTTRVCWCRDCQYFGAGSGTVNVLFTKASFTISGALSDYVSRADSGTIMHRKFCPACGTPLFSEAETRPHVIIARAGTLDDASLAAPAMTIWTASAPRWACFDDALPQYVAGAPPAP